MPQPAPTWSPDGSVIVFGFNGGVYTIRPDGTGLRLLAGGATGVDDIDIFDRATSPSVSPDGTRIAYAAFRHNGWLPWDTDIWGIDYRWDIVTSSIDGSDRRRLTRGEHEGVTYFSPVWSPDGTRIAFQSDQGEPGTWLGIYTMAADGSDVRRVAHSVEAVGGMPPSPPVWSPDGRSLVFRAEIGSDFMAKHEPGASESALYTVGIDGSNLTRLARLGRPSRNFSFQSLAWSPDGSRIAFVREDYEELKAVFTVAPDGSDLTKVYDFTYVYDLAIFPIGEVFWSTDSNRIFFINEGGVLGVVNADGSDPRAVANVPGLWPRASRSQDSSRIAVLQPCRLVGGCPETGMLFTMGHDGSNTRSLARYNPDSGLTGTVEATGGIPLSMRSLPDLKPPGPDLIVSDLYFDSVKSPVLIAVDTTFELASAVLNNGFSPSGATALRSPATTLRYFRSTDETIDRSDTQIGTNSVSAMNLGDSSGIIEITLTMLLAPGTYYYGACVDPVPDETDTTNNCSNAVGVTVQPAIPTPQFVGDIADITATVGDEFTVDLSSILSTPDKSDLVTYGFTVRPRGIIRGIIEANTGVR